MQPGAGNTQDPLDVVADERKFSARLSTHPEGANVQLPSFTVVVELEVVAVEVLLAGFAEGLQEASAGGVGKKVEVGCTPQEVLVVVEVAATVEHKVAEVELLAAELAEVGWVAKEVGRKEEVPLVMERMAMEGVTVEVAGMAAVVSSLPQVVGAEAVVRVEGATTEVEVESEGKEQEDIEGEEVTELASLEVRVAMAEEKLAGLGAVVLVAAGEGREEVLLAARTVASLVEVPMVVAGCSLL
ncbi:hypothetical protein AB1Y20_021480 [Prymnesium parvum]|uniref:Uncharacterized protein n=1 Tax=Prymnesium parvum TaxID=97485 RepID=A0AB34JME5_PRYPA